MLEEVCSSLLWLVPCRPGWQECDVFCFFHMTYQVSFRLEFFLAIVTTTMMDFPPYEVHQLYLLIKVQT